MLNKSQLQADILTLLNSSATKTGNSQQAREDFANDLGNLIDAYIKSATITIATGRVIVVGSAVTQNNIIPIVLTNAIT